MLTAPDQSLLWTDVPDPVLKPGEVLVKIHAAAVNRADILQREGQYPSPPGCPEWMGLEIAGEIVELTPEAQQKSAWKKGDLVCALLGGGGYSEYAAVKYDMLMPIPKGLTLTEAAALPEAYATSYLNLFLEGHLQAGQTAFIPAGASGLASVAIPMAKAFGARVITSARRDEQLEAIRPLRADVAFNSVKKDTAAVLAEEEAAGHPVNVVMDCVSGGMVGKCLPYLARGAYWIVIATLSGTETVVPLRALMGKALHLVGSTLRARTPDYKAYILSELVKNVWPKIEDGTIRPTIYKVLPITQADEAHAILKRNENVGKVVLTV